MGTVTKVWRNPLHKIYTILPERRKSLPCIEDETWCWISYCIQFRIYFNWLHDIIYAYIAQTQCKYTHRYVIRNLNDTFICALFNKFSATHTEHRVMVFVEVYLSVIMLRHQISIIFICGNSNCFWGFGGL